MKQNKTKTLHIENWQENFKEVKNIMEITFDEIGEIANKLNMKTGDIIKIMDEITKYTHKFKG